MCKVYTGYCGTSEIEHGLCACTFDNPLPKARALSLRTGAQTMLYLSPVIKIKADVKILRSRKENPQKLTQLSSRSHPRHLVGKRTAQKDTIIDITSDSQVNSNFPYRWSPASLTVNNYFYLFLYLYIT